MYLLENIQLAFAGLKAGKMRAFLTMLGIIIGIGSVITIVSMGSSLKASFATTLAEMGMNNIEVGLQPSGNSTTYWMEDSDLITMEMIEDMQDRFADRVEAVSISNTVGSGQLKEGRKYANANIRGVTDGYKVSNSVTVVNGRFITARDVQAAKNVAVISDFAAKKLFGTQNPLGLEVKLYQETSIHTFTVVGVYKHNMSGFGGQATSMDDLATDLYIPLTTSYYIEGWIPTGYSWFYVVAKPGADARLLADELTSYLNRYYQNNPTWKVYAYTMEAYLDDINALLSGIALFIGAVAAISLVVGGIGVMNIMLVSVTERTREIGTRKALGARNSAIRIQFIVEAIIICLIGGVLGILLGIGLGAVGSSLVIQAMGEGVLKSAFDIPVTAILVAVGFSMAIGVFFGFYPANKAAKLDPIEALRYE